VEGMDHLSYWSLSWIFYADLPPHPPYPPHPPLREREMSETIYDKLDRTEIDNSQAPDPGLDALRYLQLVYRGLIQAEGPRMRAAIAALPFEVPKLSVVASVNDPERFAERLERAITRSGLRPLMIEAKPIEPRETDAPPQTDLAKPMTTSVPDRRMRRF
jgi:hypothetical protein